ncbi:MAG: SpoVA/SpoVAEb family sporulation membrane protein [Defluviitaleaceae bacterium]|nr:SpoVA/SpoVAEb family sporulation membrane protein [Defluviitaleaceae bacterium]
MQFVNAFIAGGLICVLGQILLDKTKLAPARILVIFVVAGCVLGALGLYEPFANWAGAGAMVPLPGFGYLLWTGVRDAVANRGVSGILTGGITAAAAGISAAVLFSLMASLLFAPKEK